MIINIKFFVVGDICGVRHCLFVDIKSKGEHLLSLSFNDDVYSDSCCYCFVIVTLLIDMLLDSFKIKTTKPTAGSRSIPVKEVVCENSLVLKF